VFGTGNGKFFLTLGICQSKRDRRKLNDSVITERLHVYTSRNRIINIAAIISYAKTNDRQKSTRRDRQRVAIALLIADDRSYSASRYSSVIARSSGD